MPISHGHQPYKYSEFVAPLKSETLISELDFKQNLYDQGSAAIQAKLDSLAGFDIAKEEDRKYANQELNKIYQVIQSNSSKDFSNPQIVRSFLDISRPLENDPIFKNAKDSTTELRARQKTMADIKSKNPGLYHAANEEDFLSDVKAWMDNPNAGAILGHRDYTPYKDYSKDLMDMQAKIKADVRHEETAKGGYINETHIKEVTAERIKAAIDALSPDAKNQIQIDANYTANHTDDQTKWDTISGKLQKTIDDNTMYANTPGIETATYNPEKTTKEEFLQNAKVAQDKLDEIKKNTFDKGDRESLNQMYANDHIHSWEEGMQKIYSYQEKINKISSDPTYLQREELAARFKEARSVAEKTQENQLALIEARKVANIQEAEATGKVIIDPITGQVIPTAKTPKLSDKQRIEKAAAESYTIVKRTKNGAPIPVDENILLDEQLKTGTLPETKSFEEPASHLSPMFISKLEEKAKQQVEKQYGAGSWDADFKDDYSIDFIPDGSGKIQVKLTEKAMWGSKETTFNLDEATTPVAPVTANPNTNTNINTPVVTPPETVIEEETTAVAPTTTTQSASTIVGSLNSADKGQLKSALELQADASDSEIATALESEPGVLEDLRIQTKK